MCGGGETTPRTMDEGAWVAATPHGVLPRDSHEISPTIVGVHKLMILLRDLVKEQLQNIFGEEMGGSGAPRPPYEKTLKSFDKPSCCCRQALFEHFSENNNVLFFL